MLASLPAPHPPPALSRKGHAMRLLGAFVAGLVLFVIEVGSTAEGWPDWRTALVLFEPVCLVVSLVALAYRRRAPLPVLTICAVLSIVSLFASGALIVALGSIASRRVRREIAIALLIAVATEMAHAVLSDPALFRGPKALGVELFAAVVVYGLIVAVGLYLGARRELLAHLQSRVDNAEREQALRVAAAKVNERARIAREMHDVLAHRISMVAMHTGVLAYRDDLTAAQIKQTATVAQEGAHTALVELREVLGVLRQLDGTAGDSPPSPEPPQPTVAGITHLVEEARTAGQIIELTSSLDVDAVPASLGRTVYRVVQEALTNARKHAPGATVIVELSGDERTGVKARVSNAVTTSSVSAIPGSGLGLTGLRERTAVAGGWLNYGIDDGRFVLTAWVPWPAAVA